MGCGGLNEATSISIVIVYILGNENKSRKYCGTKNNNCMSGFKIKNQQHSKSHSDHYL